MSDQDKNLAKQVIAEIVRQAGGQLDNKTNLFKAFYLAHLIYADRQPGYLTFWPIVRMPRGPGIDRSDVLIGELIAEEVLTVKQLDYGDFHGFRFELTGNCPDAAKLSPEAIEAISLAVKFVDGKSAEEVSDFSHRLSKTWQEAQNGEELNIYVDAIPEDEYRQREARMTEIASIFSEEG
ncbi:MAG: hypothetical protein HQ567_09710 [Candidatus Nealsonbacteria bacterium]|nr:hypothetical protein [Candidatus Nealsonbacteria bacterium]